jgi:DNA-directed RNA polymerase subunit RPC12/RpoP
MKSEMKKLMIALSFFAITADVSSTYAAPPVPTGKIVKQISRITQQLKRNGNSLTQRLQRQGDKFVREGNATRGAYAGSRAASQYSYKCLRCNGTGIFRASNGLTYRCAYCKGSGRIFVLNKKIKIEKSLQ